MKVPGPHPLGRPGAEPRGPIGRVEHRTGLEREAPAADASGEIVAQAGQLADPIVDALDPPLRQGGPIVAARSPIGRKTVELPPDLVEAEPDPLRKSDEGDAPQDVSWEAAMPGGRALGRDEIALFVVAQGGWGDPAACSDVADAQSFIVWGWHGPGP